MPYNSYKLHWAKVKSDDVIKPLHINQDLARYELHRVWVVDATLKAGQRHIYKRRTFYIDEDSWQIIAVDCYDNRDQLWRVQEGHGDQLLQRADLLDDARSDLRPAVAALPRARLRGPAGQVLRLQHHAVAAGLHGGGTALARDALSVGAG